MQKIKEIIELIDLVLKEDAENALTSWNIINDSYDEKVDEYRDIIYNSKDWLSSYQSELINKTWIWWLKIKFTSASWYFIEITKSNLKNIPDFFIHKQTLVNASRFITSELKEFEWKLLNAESVLFEREYELFLELRWKLLSSFSSMKEFAEKWANIDFCSALSRVAYSNSYSRPQIINSYELLIKNWRHPVIESIEKDFISNDLSLDKNKYINIITGPNMWWKSTFLRQSALIILMAHIWSFVPASSAVIPLTDKIFSRVWATDNLYLWQSTFMVEMQEVSNILNNSTEKSFVIIDEIGRWTSTYDWMSLAWAILKYNHDKIKAKTLFATHYHELIDDSKELSWVENYSVAVWENEENLVFLRKIIKWWIKRSFWIEVASIAWINKDVISEARKKLHTLELEHDKSSVKQLSLWTIINTDLIGKNKKSEFEQEIEKIDIENMTPIDAFNKILELKKKV